MAGAHHVSRTCLIMLLGALIPRPTATCPGGQDTFEVEIGHAASFPDAPGAYRLPPA